MTSRRRRRASPRAPLAVLLPAWCVLAATACGGRGSGDATPIPSTGVPVAAASARGVDLSTISAPPTTPVDPFGSPSPTSPPPGMPVIPPHDPFAPPVSPPPVPPVPTGTGVPL